MIKAVEGSPSMLSLSKQENIALIKLQSVVRGWLTRRKIEPEKKRLREISAILLKKETLPGPENGSDVYFFNTVVIKYHKFFLILYREIQSAKNFCKSEKFDLLVVPETRVFQGHLIQERLPITDSLKEQIGIYIENHIFFGKAIKQFTLFYIQTDYPDVLGKSTHPYNYLEYNFLPRYDNVSFFIREGVGHLALVDIEDFAVDKSWFNKDISKKMITLAHLFPYHIKSIIKTVEELFPQVKIPREQMEEAKDISLTLFDKLYLSHKRFLQTKGVNVHNPYGGKPRLTSSEIEDIATSLKIDPVLIVQALDFLNGQISNIDNVKNWPQLLVQRSILNIGKINQELYKELVKRECIHCYLIHDGE